MKRDKNQWSRCMVTMLLAMMAWTLPQKAWADNGAYDTPSQAISWYSKGQGCLHLKILMYNKSPKRTLDYSTFYVRDSEGNRTDVFYMHQMYDSESDAYVTSKFRNMQDGASVLYLTNDIYWNPLCLITGNEVQREHTRSEKGGDCYAEFDWYYPTTFAGKTYTFCVDGQLFVGTANREEYKKDIGTMEFDEINIQAMSIIPGTDEGEEGTLKIPVSGDHVINWIEASYTDEDGNPKDLGRTTLPKNSYSGYVKLPATEIHKNLKITVNVVSGKVNPSDVPRPEWPQQNTGNITIDYNNTDDVVMHNPRMLKADFLTYPNTENLGDAGSVLLRWKVREPKYNDVVEGDMFVIQRTMTGKPEDYEVIGSIALDNTLEEYEFKDSMLIEALTPELIDKTLGIPLVRYRVMRASSTQMWGLQKNPTVAYAQPQMSTLSLFNFAGFSTSWKNQTEHIATINWVYSESDADKYSYVWDSRDEKLMILRMFNRNMELVDSATYKLTEEEILAQEKDVLLPRSCIYYEVELKTNPQKSPIGRGTAEIFTAINSKEDFEAYANALSQNLPVAPNAIMTNNISISSTNLNHWLGMDEKKPYTGNFNGNGHTLYVTYPSANDLYMAPFRFAGSGAVISNLTTAGSLNPRNKFASAMVGMISTGELHIENCIAHMIIDSSVKDDCSHGGFVGVIDMNDGTDNSKELRISNSLFAGKFHWDQNIGGFVGWRRKDVFGMISNSFFNPEMTMMNSKDKGSASFMRDVGENAQWSVIQDCRYTDLDRAKKQGIMTNTPPDNWCWDDGKPAIRQMGFAASMEYTASKEMLGDNFYFENLGHVDKQSITAQTLQSSVVLRWKNVDDQPVDYYEVWRRDSEKDDFETIATQLTDVVYEDKTTSPIKNYFYYVRGVNNCEGTKYENTDTIPGNCIQTGMVEGYLRFPDGTGIPGEEIVITSPDGSTYTTKTDESGYYRKEGLPYINATETVYTISVNINGFGDMRSLRFGTKPGDNSVKDMTFVVDKSVKFSGYVQYSGTSIPVQGVTFLVDDREVHTASGKVMSDHEGKFSFRMLEGDHKIQAKKDGHVFYQHGYYHENDNLEQLYHNFSTDKAGIYFYDDTKVKLIGRVAGGKDQAELPLDNSLSRNNLGDDLQMVLTLEGDNKSRLVWDILDRNLKERDTVYHHTRHDNLFDYQTQVHTTLNRMVVTPDVHTGEYQVWLPPVKWKIQQITAKGYATLFQDGQINDVIDLTDSLTEHIDHFEGKWKAADKNEVKAVDVKYYAQYNRIYHSPVLIEYKQMGYENFDYFGEHYYNAKNLAGESEKVPLCYPVRKENWPVGRKDSLVAKYTFGAPVFDIAREYPIKISAVEKYFYNNNTKSDTIDIIRLSGGIVTIQNGFESGTTQYPKVELDSVGEGIYFLKAQQVPYLLTGKDALRTVTMTLEMDGTYYEAEPLRGYMLNVQTLPGAKDYLTMDKPQLIDILRDPPGGGSSAKLSKGSTLKYSYTLNWSVKGGVELQYTFGASTTLFTGVSVGIGTAAMSGIVQGGKAGKTLSLGIIISGSGNKGWSYTMTTTDDISTSSDKTMIGADADVYIGTVTSYGMKPATAIRAIPESMWKTLQGELKAGRMLEIANGFDEKGDTFHLVRDEVVSIQPEIKSTFVHSQKYITSQLIPELKEELYSLMFTGTAAEAQTKANTTGKPVYLSLRKVEDDRFGMVNTTNDEDDGEYIRNVYGKEDPRAKSYVIVLPTTNGYKDTGEDLVRDFCMSMLEWINLIAQNEREKLSATELVKTFDIDGGAGLNYSESFKSDFSATEQFKAPWQSSSSIEILGSGLKVLGGFLKSDPGGPKITTENPNAGTKAKDNPWSFTTTWAGLNNTFAINPVAEFDVTMPNGYSKSFDRKESFTISMDKKSHLILDVYRVKTDVDDVAADKNGLRDVFVNTNFDDQTEESINKATSALHLLTVDNHKSDMKYARSFVYRTRGGATVRPWEDARYTKYYQEGMQLDERTKKIENPVIKLDKQSISGVPFDEPARFKIYMTNESEAPEAIGGALKFFTLYLNTKSNPKGARLLVDGLPLSQDGTTIQVLPGEVTEKTLEVWASEEYDYENLKIGLISQGDVQCVDEVQFSVHFLQTAGGVAISMPGDKWIMNTDAPYDSEKGWYLPVIISGFNKNQHNFDHIEFQYKETTRGDDYWTNLCGFYNDSTIYQAASGTKEMIPENGNIITQFFGEGVEMEKAYDLRAVLFCRNGNGFLTSSSKVLSGVKDTRRPQLFGTPEPKDGILGAGDNIVFNFSEDIEYNYLQETTNFEVKGETNETAISEEPSLLFDGEGYAESDARRNFSDKSVTIEVMIKPDNVNKAMPIFSHGRDGKQLQLWLTENKHLRAVVDDHVLESPQLYTALGFQRVALVLDNEHKRMSIIAKEVEATMDSVTYSGYGPLIFGSTNQTDVSKRSFFQGRMLQGRLWNRAMDLNLLNTYGNQMLTGYEMGLTDYYPMNEGRGNYATDLAQGAHLHLNGAAWALPRGMSLYLDKKEKRDIKGMRIRADYIERSAELDYTLMFWFKTTSEGRGTLLANGSGRKTDVGAYNKFFIGFEGETLKYRSNGQEFALGKTFSDDEWHHFAMTVNRSHQVASIYVDNNMKAQFVTDSLGGMSGDTYLGNMVWQEEGLNRDVVHQQNPYTGYIDGIILFKQALPLSLISRYSTKSLSGSEKGLVTNIEFCRQERQKNGDLTLEAFALNHLVTYDENGNVVEKNDSVFIEPVADIMAHIDRSIGAPVQSYEELRNLNFDYVGRNNQLLVDIDELDSRINKRTVYVTVSDIPDINGNFMASPATVAVFIDRNPLRWSQKTFKATLSPISSNDYTFDINIINSSGAPHTYKLENLPKWLNVNTPTDIIEPKTEQTLTFSINKDTNVGNYDNIIYLTDEDGLSEPLMLNITLEGAKPDWYASTYIQQFSMSIVARVQIGDDIVTDSRDVVGVFDSMGRCMGHGNVNYDPATSESLVYLTVYDSMTVARPIGFKLWHYETGKTMVLTPSQNVEFKPETFIGTTKSPLVLKAGSQYIQTIHLLPGWNWISLNVTNEAFHKVSNLLSWYNWREGDMLTDENNNLSLLYQYGQWISNKGSESLDNIALSVSNSYRVKVVGEANVELTGNIIKSVSDRTITIDSGWNSIGYTPMINLPVSTALADYLDDATDGDVVKSKTQFAIFTIGANGSREWKGNLQYMKPGEGYMLYRQKKGMAKFAYPFYESNATFLDGTANIAPKNNGYAHNMTMTAIVDGIEILSGDRIIAYSDGEVRGETIINAQDTSDHSPLLFLTIAGDKKTPLNFIIEREGDIIAATGEVMSYENDAISGSPKKPTPLVFKQFKGTSEGLYDLSGRKIPASSMFPKGVYIINGRKFIVK